MIPDRDRPIAIDFTGADLCVTLANQRQITIPLANFPVLLKATSQQRAHVQLSLSGIYWPELNLDISLLELLGGLSASSRSHKPRFCEG
ncbi:MAG: DUF2442 domain-containing protein [Anaerolineaceae bacterium]|nr:DUF2442 domain-containing protein [Anaerolineaceae bacterium]